MDTEHRESDAGQSGETMVQPAETSGAPSRDWAAPRQRSADKTNESIAPTHPTSADLRDHPPTAVAAQFRDLRARLFGPTAVTEFPVELPDEFKDRSAGDHEYDAAPEAVSQPPLDPIREIDVTELPYTAPGEAQAEQLTTLSFFEDYPAVADPEAPEPQPAPDLDWAKVSPQYVPDVTEHDRRNRIVALVLLALAIVAVGVWMLFGPNSAPSRPAASTPSAVPTSAADFAGTPSSKSEVGVLDDGLLEVKQTVVFKDAISEVVLQMPDFSQTPALDDFDPKIDDIAVLIEGIPIDTGDAEKLRSGEDVTVPLPLESRAVTVDYTLSGAVIPRGTKPGRGLALANAIDVRTTPLESDVRASPRDADALPTEVKVLGPRILNLACTQPGEPQYVCGSDVPGDWVYQDNGTEQISVIAQVDLPPA